MNSKIRGRSAAIFYDDFAIYCPYGCIRTWKEELSLTTSESRRRLGEAMVAPMPCMYRRPPQGTVLVAEEELR